MLTVHLAPGGSIVCKQHLSFVLFEHFCLPPAHRVCLPRDIFSHLTLSYNEPVPRGKRWWLRHISHTACSPSRARSVTARGEIFLQTKVRLGRKVRKEVKEAYKG